MTFAILNTGHVIFATAGEVVIERNDAMAVSGEALAQMGTYESSSARHQDQFFIHNARGK